MYYNQICEEISETALADKDSVDRTYVEKSPVVYIMKHLSLFIKSSFCFDKSLLQRHEVSFSTEYEEDTKTYNLRNILS